MIKGFLKLIAGSLLVMGIVLGLSFMSLQAADAQSVQESACLGSGGTWSNGQCVNPNDNRTLPEILRQVSNILIFIVGAVSVLMGVIGGLRYALSQGDSNATSSAKNTILYAIIGVVLSMTAYGLVNFITVQVSQ